MQRRGLKPRRQRSARKLGRKNWRRKGGGRDGWVRKYRHPVRGEGRAAAGAWSLRDHCLQFKSGRFACMTAVKARPCSSLKSQPSMPDQPETPKGKTVGNYDPALVLAKATLRAISVIGGSLASCRCCSTAGKTKHRNAMALLRGTTSRFRKPLRYRRRRQRRVLGVVSILRSIMERTHRDEKLRAAANILANLLLKPGDQAKVSYDELDHLIRRVEALVYWGDHCAWRRPAHLGGAAPRSQCRRDWL